MSHVILSSPSENVEAPGTSNDQPIGTASRLITASGQHFSSRSSNMRIKVEDMPTSRGGLGIIQTKEGLADRQVQGRTYYVGVVRSKVSELKSEIQRLQREIDSFTEDNKQYFSLNKTAEHLSQQIVNIRNELDDYNMARMNSFSEVTDVKKEIDDLNAHNQQVESTIDEIYLDKQRKEEQIQRLERELSNEKQRSERLLENMNPELRQRYNKIKSTSNHLQTQMNSMQSEISSLEVRMTKMRQQISNTDIKQEAFSLVEQIYELELKQEHQTSTEQIQDDNQELSAIEKQIHELLERNEYLKQSDNYNELKMEEQHIDEFVSSYEQTREQYLLDIRNIQQTNLNLLVMISRTCDNYPKLKSNFNQDEMQKSNDTLTVLAEQHRKLKQDYTKLETLDKKFADELQELKPEYIKMQEDLEKFNDLESLKRKAEKRKQQLTLDKINMMKQRQITKTEIQTLQSQFEAIQTQLRDNITHQQLVSLEKQLQSSSQILFALDEALVSQNVQSQYEQIKRQALDLVQTHNRWLIQRLQNSSFA